MSQYKGETIMENEDEKIASIFKRIKHISDKKTEDIIKEHLTIKNDTFDLDLSSLDLSPEEEDRIASIFLAAL
jgi:hypothetical protein